MLFQKKDLRVIYNKENKEVGEIVAYLSHAHHRLKVEYAGRKEFLKSFIPLLLNKEKGVGLINVSSLAETLHLAVDFMDADGGTNTLGAKSIEVEIHNIYHEMCSKE